MSKQSNIAVVSLVLITSGVAGFMYWKNMQQSAMPQGFPPAVISATDVKTERWQPSLQSVGSLVAINGINVSTEVNGIVSEIAFTSGQPVEKNQILIKLDDAVDKAALEALRSERRLAEVQFKRASNLLKKSVTSKSTFDEAKAHFDAASARVKQQEAIIDRKIIRAPFAGLSGIRMVNLGQYIEAGNPLVSLQVLDPVYVDYTLPERYVMRVKTGQTVKLKMDAIPDKIFSGEISAVNPGIDVGSRTLKARATLANPDNLMRPGMFAQVETITDEAKTVLTLPNTAISFNTYGNYVFVINKNEAGMSMVKRTLIQSGETRNGRVAISGLQAGTQVVRTGLVKLRDGMPVKIDNSVQLNDAEIEGE